MSIINGFNTKKNEFIYEFLTSELILKLFEMMDHERFCKILYLKFSGIEGAFTPRQPLFETYLMCWRPGLRCWNIISGNSTSISSASAQFSKPVATCINIQAHLHSKFHQVCMLYLNLMLDLCHSYDMVILFD